MFTRPIITQDYKYDGDLFTITIVYYARDGNRFLSMKEWLLYEKFHFSCLIKIVSFYVKYIINSVKMKF